MPVACSTLPFTHRPLAEVLSRIAGLGFTAWELPIRGDGVHLGHLDPDLLRQDSGVGELILEAHRAHPGLRCVGAGFEIAKSSPLDREAELFSGCCALLRRLAAPAVTIFLYDDGAAPVTERYRVLHDIARNHDLQLRVETHLNTATALPARALELCRALDLQVMLDASHYRVQGIALADYRDLWPYVGAVQVRACAPGRMELPAADFKPSELIPVGYTGQVIVEYINRTVAWDATLAALRTSAEVFLAAAHPG